MDSRAINNRNQQPMQTPHASELERRKKFSDTEVGITHPDLPGFIRINDSGDIEIFAAPGVGIVISGKSKSISLFAESIRFNTNEDGLRWNSFNFNYSASTYIEPTLVKVNRKTINTAQNNVFHYLNALEQIRETEKPTTINIVGDYGFGKKVEIPKQPVDLVDFKTNISEEELELMESYAFNNSENKVNYMFSLLKEGYTFIQAEEKTKRDLNE